MAYKASGIYSLTLSNVNYVWLSMIVSLFSPVLYQSLEPSSFLVVVVGGGDQKHEAC